MQSFPWQLKTSLKQPRIQAWGWHGWTCTKLICQYICITHGCNGNSCTYSWQYGRSICLSVCTMLHIYIYCFQIFSICLGPNMWNNYCWWHYLGHTSAMLELYKRLTPQTFCSPMGSRKMISAWNRCNRVSTDFFWFAKIWLPDKLMFVY